MAILPLGGFMLYHWFWGSQPLSLFLLVALSTVVMSLVQEVRYRDSLPYRQMFVLTCSAAIVYACYQVGLRGLIYAFPMASVFFFTFRLSHGMITGTLFSTACLVAAMNIEEPVLVFRFAIGITICMIFAAIFAFIVQRQKDDLARQASTDALTGALNRKLLPEKLESNVQLSRRNGTPVSLLLIDLDHFKMVNDQYGHLVGDQVLIDFAALVTGRIRTYDNFFRFGGEEFLVLLPQTSTKDAAVLAESIRCLIQDASFNNQIRLTCSIGVSQWQPDDSIESWLKACDNALYEAKTQGRNRVALRPI
ncbi:GGDEF domain-containing protein [Salinispirillum sp. LH 10-3-1]|uniref:diguanylate cyclase n=1 Tax=Salinispirillum sp. LH 10-3-1 TaxID=2952525 RepID=A0AB38YF65_9GAMM